MSAPPYMRLYWGDYSRKTRHLRSAAEHGAYLLLIGALWDNGGRLPADDTILASHALLDAEQWAELRPVIMPFFKVRRGSLSHERVTEELQKYEATSGKRKEAGKRGGEASGGKPRRNRQAIAKQMPTYSESNTDNPPYPPAGGRKIDFEIGFTGPADVLLAALDECRNDPAIASYFARSAWRDLPERVLTAPNEYAARCIRNGCRKTLKQFGFEVIAEPAQPERKAS